MSSTDFQSVDEYIAAQPEDSQGVLRRVRNVLRKALPGAEETISYRIPTYKLNGAAVLYFAGWKQHYSIYPASDPLKASLASELAAYKIDKGTIRFPLSEPVPVGLIQAIARFRADEVLKREKVKHISPRKRQNSKLAKRAL